MALASRAGVNLFTLRKFEQKGLISLESFLKIAMVLGLLAISPFHLPLMPGLKIHKMVLMQVQLNIFIH